ncbi:MAG: hypothetical protein FJZ01_10285 [Candidatus Sericytochromatia bacterium]|nr:hypothetical protein [Candidatus Tanganyikabacteria bacterium]
MGDVKLTDQGVEAARRKGLDLGKLSKAGREALDADGDGAISAGEADAAARIADSDGSGWVGAEEAERFLRGYDPATPARTELQQFDLSRNGTAEHARGVAREAAKAEQEAKAALEAAAAALGGAVPPEAGAEELRKRLGSLRHPDGLELRLGPLRAAEARIVAERDALAADLAGIDERMRAIDAEVSRLGNREFLLKRTKSLADWIAKAEADQAAAERAGKPRSASLDEMLARDRAVVAKDREVLARMDAELGKKSALAYDRKGAARKHAGAEKRLAAKRDELAPLEAEKRDLATLRSGLERQLAYAEAKEALAVAQARARAAERMARSRVAAEDAELAERSGAAREAVRAAEAGIPGLEARALEVAQRMGRPAFIRREVAEGRLDADHVALDRIEEELATYREILQGLEARVVEHVAPIKAMLGDRAFQETLKRMPDGDRAELLGSMVAVLLKTPEGRAFASYHLEPALRGERDAFEPAWAELLGGKAGDATGIRTRLRVLEELAPLLVPREDGAEQFGAVLARSLGITPAKLEAATRAAALRQEGRHQEADALLDREGLSHLKTCIQCVKKPIETFRVLAMARHVLKAPEVMQAARTGAVALKAAVGKAVVAAEAGLPAWLKAAGKPLAVADVALGFLTLYGIDRPHDRGDVGSTVGHSVSILGSSLAAAAAFGLVTGPVGIAGILIGLAGIGIGALFGDSATEKWLEQNGFSEYMR